MWNGFEYFVHLFLPQVSNIQARAVVLSWAPPVGLSCGPHSGLSFPYSYEVALSDKGRDGKYKIIYRLCIFSYVFLCCDTGKLESLRKIENKENLKALQIFLKVVHFKN